MIRRCGIAVRAPAVATPVGSARTFEIRDELLPEFLESRNGAFVSGVTATRLRADRNGRIVGVTCRTLDGGRKLARAHSFVLACGGVQSARLLLLSKSQRFPRGIGNDHDRVGRGFNDHALIAVSGYLPKHALFHKPREAHASHCYRAFRRNGLGAVQPVFSQTPRIARLISNHEAADWPRQALRALQAPFDPVLEIAGHIETKPLDSNRVSLSRSCSDPFGDPAAHLHFAYSSEDRHLIRKTRELLNRWLIRIGAQIGKETDEVAWAGNAIGTCRMGPDPGSSVCDPTLRVHATPNLYLCGAETFPSGSALPPALTIAAFAHRLADHVIARARWCSRAPTTRQPRPVPTAAAPAVALLRRRPQS
jgi:choline dehydrogenase-like flavoprotein